jgi:hypothetical protein
LGLLAVVLAVVTFLDLLAVVWGLAEICCLRRGAILNSFPMTDGPVLQRWC